MLISSPINNNPCWKICFWYLQNQFNVCFCTISFCLKYQIIIIILNSLFFTFGLLQLRTHCKLSFVHMQQVYPFLVSSQSFSTLYEWHFHYFCMTFLFKKKTKQYDMLTYFWILCYDEHGFFFWKSLTWIMYEIQSTLLKR